MTTNDLIRQLREAEGASQQETATKLGMARSTYAALEDDREPKLSELQRLVQLYNVTLDELSTGRLEADPEILSEETLAEDDVQPREEPTLQPEKLREVLLYLTNKIGAKANVGETVLYKLLYFIDFDFYEKHGRSITGLTYVKLAHGPVPKQKTFLSIREKMIQSQEIEIVKTKYFSHDQKKYLPLKALNEISLSSLSAQELEHINWEIDRLSDHSAAQLSEFSHYDMPWLTAKEGEEINYRFVYYRSGMTAVTEPEDAL